MAYDRSPGEERHGEEVTGQTLTKPTSLVPFFNCHDGPVSSQDDAWSHVHAAQICSAGQRSCERALANPLLLAAPAENPRQDHLVTAAVAAELAT
ncbi:hypothetical protein ACIRPU_41665 [Streptomyces sp. NPDC102259]|uniref:hypothetical protein n=1 Tax=Streptomyces sp. NPDC102259 TaxID=3366148 RepID=UPI00382A9C70